MKNDDAFTSFACKSCGTEIEASLDMIGEHTECPACGASIIVPDNQQDDILRHGPLDTSMLRDQAMKSKTIRIELSDI